MNNKRISEVSTDELTNRSKREDKLFLKYLKLFWLVFLGGLIIYPTLLVITDFSKLPTIVADIFAIVWFVATMMLLFIYTHYQRVSKLDHNELAKREK